ncbi:MAG: hypothetical protein KKH77_00325 [Candidatus Omnitrophica bacterium]|nr:hypothetical protein [Candidatus Omnitrophota bacterium]
MSHVKMMKRGDLSGYRMLTIAIAVSLILHVFWLSVIKIVSSRMPESSIKFSKIAFLGPILSGLNMEVRASPASRGMLEIRYRKIAGKRSYIEDSFRKAQDSKDEYRTASGRTDKALVSIIGDAVCGKKLEPDFPAE